MSEDSEMINLRTTMKIEDGNVFLDSVKIGTVRHEVGEGDGKDYYMAVSLYGLEESGWVLLSPVLAAAELTKPGALEVAARWHEENRTEQQPPETA